eukprot:gene34623-57432_t
MPNINTATARVLDACGIQTVTVPKAGCCGALKFHLNDHDGAKDEMRRNIDALHGLVSTEVVALCLAERIGKSAAHTLVESLARRAVQEPGYGEAVEERFGRYTQPREAAPVLVWLHAVSLGETRTAAILLKALRTAYPGMRLLLTHGTATGRAEGRALLQPGDVQVWQPWDTHAVVEQFFDHFKPRLGLLMETEIWPCAVASAKARQLPLLLVNGR